MKHLVIAVILCGAVSTASAQTLVEAVEATLDFSPIVKLDESNLAAAKELRAQAKSGYLPSVDLLLGVGQERSDNTTTRANGLLNEPVTRQERSLQISQMLYDGSFTRNRVREQGYVVDASSQRLFSTQENISLRAATAYLEMLRREQMVGLARTNLEQHEDTLGKIEERFESGVGTKVDVVQTLGRRAQSKSNLLLSEKELLNGRAEYFQVVGVNPAGLSLPSRPSGLPVTVEEAISLAFANNPGLQAAESDLQAARALRKQISSAFQPRFDLVVGATRNDDTDGSPGANDDETAVIRMSYNLFRGGADRARAREADARIIAAEQSVVDLKQTLTQNVTILWNELEDLNLRMEYLQAHVTSTEEVLEVYKEQLALGKRTLLDLLDIQNELFRARSAYITAEFGLRLAEYRLLAVNGQFLRSLGVSTSQEGAS